MVLGAVRGEGELSPVQRVAEGRGKERLGIGE